MAFDAGYESLIAVFLPVFFDCIVFRIILDIPDETGGAFPVTKYLIALPGPIAPASLVRKTCF